VSNSSGAHALSCGLYALSLLTKESFVLFPVVFPFLYAWVEHKGSIRLRDAARQVVWLALVLVGYAAIRWVLQASLAYGLPGSAQSIDLGIILRSLGLSGPLLFGFDSKGDHPPLSIGAGMLVVLLQGVHTSWRIRAAGLIWILAGLGPHLNIPETGANYVFGARPWVSYTVVLAIERWLVGSRGSPLFSWFRIAAVASMIVLSYGEARDSAAPWATAQDVSRKVIRPGCRLREVGIQVLCKAEKAEVFVGSARPDGSSSLTKFQFVLGWLLHVPMERVHVERVRSPEEFTPRARRGSTMGIDWAARVKCRPSSAGQ
jgi:hypothetical protein